MIKKLFGYSLGTWLGAIFALITVPIASHIFPKHELGIINYYYSIVNIIFTFLLLGLDQAYLRFYAEYKSDQIKSSVFRTNITFSVIVILLCAAVCIPFRNQISQLVIGKDFPLLLVVFAFHLIGLLITRYYSILYRLQSSLLKYTIVSVVNTLLLKAAYIAGTLHSSTAVAGLVASAILPLLAACILMFVEKEKLSLRLTGENGQLFKAELIYGFPLIPTMLIAILNNNVPTFFLRSLNGFANVAEYSVGVTIASSITLLHNGLNTFLEPYVFKNYKTDKDTISNILDIFTKLALFICMAVICFQDLFFLIFDKEYISVTSYLPILFASSLWYSVGDFYNIGIKIQKDTKKNIPVYALGIVVNIVLCIILIPKWGNLGAAIAAATASFIISTLKIVTGNKAYPVLGSAKTYVNGSLFLLLIIAINLAVSDSLLRILLIGATWVISGFVLGVYQEVLHYFCTLRNKNTGM